jgi:hypothetical protein
LSQLSALQGVMAARLISTDRDETVVSDDTLLTVDQAAERLRADRASDVSHDVAASGWSVYAWVVRRFRDRPESSDAW